MCCYPFLDLMVKCSNFETKWVRIFCGKLPRPATVRFRDRSVEQCIVQPRGDLFMDSRVGDVWRPESMRRAVAP